MKIIHARRISQAFFFLLFVWFCWVTRPGTGFVELRGWPVSGFFRFDPLAALSLLLATGTFYAPFAPALVTAVATVFLGRFFCGFVCPFGAVHQFLSWLSLRKKKLSLQVRAYAHHPAQRIKYLVLVFFLAMAFLGFNQAGLLNPLSLLQRGINLCILPLVQLAGGSGIFPVFMGVGLVGALFFAAVLANFRVPRFFCRFVCPLGALFGVLSRFSVWRMGKSMSPCSNCMGCQAHCQGACEPAGEIRATECVLCMNCLDACPDQLMGYRTTPSLAGENPRPDLSRRGFVLSAASGLGMAALGPVSGAMGHSPSKNLVRPPGSITEDRFLGRCVQCGACMRVCPSNVIQPAGLSRGLTVLWTPVLDFRLGKGGCLPGCVACSLVCPTAAIRPLTPDRRTGRGAHENEGPIRIGCAFVDRGRCLPWAMGRPCLVCQENCPVSPKAIITREVFQPLPQGAAAAQWQGENRLILEKPLPNPGGELFAKPGLDFSGPWARVQSLRGTELVLENKPEWGRDLPPGKIILSQRLLRPYVDPARCIGCGACEHECPVSGRRAIRVGPENETRDPQSRLLAG